MTEAKIFNTIEELEAFVLINQIKKIDIKEKNICITRTKNGPFAFENSCPHYSVPLETANINYLGEVVCSLHSYRFNLKNGWETTGKDLCLKRYKIELKPEGVYIIF